MSNSQSSGTVIITAAVTGAIHTPTMSAHLPITPEQIASHAIAAAEAGAAILHLHARDPDSGKPDQTPEAFARFLSRIKHSTKAVINITTGGSPFMKVEERVLPAAQFKPEVASLNMGSINFGLYPAAGEVRGLQVRLGAPAPRGHPRSRLPQLVQGHRVHPRDLHRQRHPLRVRVLRHRPSLQPGAFRRPGPRQAALLRPVGLRHPRRHRLAPRGRAHMKRTADRLFGTDYRWSCSAPARASCASRPCRRRWEATSASASRMSLGGQGKLAKSNAEQVRLARQIVEGLGLAVATPDDARAILSLKGGDQVGF